METIAIITHKLLGWHWAHVKFGYSYELRHVRTSPTQRLFVTCYGTIIYLNKDGWQEGGQHARYMPFTWKLSEKE